jgi:nitroreductase
MSANEELKEGIEHAKEPFDRRVAGSMAIIAALLAIVSVGAHIYTTEEILAQQKASDQWAYYQAKDIRRYDSEIALDVLQAATSQAAGKRIQHYSDNAARYEKERAEIQNQARELEAERDMQQKRAFRLEFGEIFLEIGIVLASLSILTKTPQIWYLSLLSAGAGVLIAATMLVIH